MKRKSKQLVGKLSQFSFPLLLFLIAFRSLNALLIQTYFQPDEYYQSQEVAHDLVYGYGYLTWEWRYGLRGIFYPTIISIPYRILRFCGIDSAWLLRLGPRLIQALISAIAEWYSIGFAIKLYDSSIIPYMLFNTIFSFMNWFVSTRTLSNTFECNLTSIALFFWPLNDQPFSIMHFTTSIFIISLAFMIRPTTLIFWIVPAISLFYNLLTNRFYHLILICLLLSVFAFSFSIMISFFIDSMYYKSPTITALNFISFNVFQNLSSYYGIQRLDYYFTEGLGLLLAGQIPFFISSGLRNKFLILSIAVPCLAFTMIAHKEMRFILPLMPLILCACSRGMQIMKLARKRVLTAFAIFVNVTLALYLGLVHQAGVIDLMGYISELPVNSGVTFLMPCHSTPWQSYIHRSDLNLKQLYCEPPLGQPNAKLMCNESNMVLDSLELAMTHPIDLFETENLDYWSDYICFFDNIEERLKSLPEAAQYEQCARFFNSHFIDDPRKAGDVVVWCRTRL